LNWYDILSTITRCGDFVFAKRVWLKARTTLLHEFIVLLDRIVLVRTDHKRAFASQPSEKTLRSRSSHHIDRAISSGLQNKLVRIDKKACARLSTMLSTKYVPEDREESDLPNLNAQQIGNFYLFLVAICHQTSPRGGLPLQGNVDGQNLRGWDYLSAKFELAVARDPKYLSPNAWAYITIDNMRTIFSDPAVGLRLNDWERRVDLIRDLGRFMLSKGWFWFEEAYHYCEHRAMTRLTGIVEVLAGAEAYNDPLRKKSLYLLSVLRNNQKTNWRYSDEERIGPPVDYHEIRGHLRLGTVKVVDRILATKLIEELPVTKEEDLAIRWAVYYAIMLISKLTPPNTPSRLHYLFWNVFRTYCRQHVTYCEETPTDFLLPSRYLSLSSKDTELCCPFAKTCTSRHIATPAKYSEHVIETEYY
jgi:hypothetical protein